MPRRRRTQAKDPRQPFRVTTQPALHERLPFFHAAPRHDIQDLSSAVAETDEASSRHVAASDGEPCLSLRYARATKNVLELNPIPGQLVRREPFCKALVQPHGPEWY